MKRTIDRVEKNPMEYKSHLDGDIFAIVTKLLYLLTINIAETRNINYMACFITQTISIIL